MRIYATNHEASAAPGLAAAALRAGTACEGDAGQCLQGHLEQGERGNGGLWNDF